MLVVTICFWLLSGSKELPDIYFLSQTALQGCDYKSLPNPAAVVCGYVTRNSVCLLRRESVRTMKSMSSMSVFMYLRLS